MSAEGRYQSQPPRLMVLPSRLDRTAMLQKAVAKLALLYAREAGEHRSNRKTELLKGR